jgi:FMN reductase [NAD(P)H]
VVLNEGLRQGINDRTLNAMTRSGNIFLQQRTSLPGYQPIYGAPVLILLSGPVDAPYSTLNTALAGENMLLEATGFGPGSCYPASPTFALNGNNNRDLAQQAGIPDGYAVQCAVIVVYAAAEKMFALGELTRKGSVHYVD